MAKAIKCQVTIGSMSLKEDNSVKFSTHTPELTDEQLSGLRSLHNKACEMWLKPLDETPEEIITVDADLNQKSQSQRIRAVLYLLWQKDNEDFSDFDIYYRNKTEKYLNSLKARLDE